MKTIDEIKKLDGFEFISEISKIILFSNELKEFGKWTKPELLAFYREWKHYEDWDEDGVHILTMKSTKQQMRIIVGRILGNMIRQVVFNNGGSDLSRKDILDYITTKRREILIDELLKK